MLLEHKFNDIKGNSVSDSCCALTSMGLVLPLLFSLFVKFMREVGTI